MKLITPIAALLLATSAYSAQIEMEAATDAPPILIQNDPVLDADKTFDERHKLCLEAIASDPETAYESAMIWVGRGGGHRAKHCEAMALFAIGQTEEAGFRLDKLVAAFPENGGREIDKMRMNYGTEAAQSWLQAGKLDRAWNSATRALEIEPAHAAARITRARTYFAMDRVDDAHTDLDSVLAFHPDHPQALRFRADARMRKGELDAALQDAELSLSIEPTVETALIRGHIREAIAKNQNGETP